jgi:segregation and condensation protein A
MNADDETGAAANDPFEEDRPDYGASSADRLLLDIEGFEGPIDVLLSLARDQKVDLTRISILALAEQYLEFIARARQMRLELAADYLVMAAWLAYLKSRLLLPAPAGEEEPSGAEMAAILAFQLQRLEGMKDAAAKLFERPMLGQAVFRRGEPEPLKIENRATFEVTLYDILRAYGRQYARQEGSTLHIAPTELYSIEDALQRLRALIGNVPDWTVLSKFLPPGLKDPLLVRSALASTFVATLELARNGRIEIQQNEAYAPVFIRTSRRAE